MDGARQTLLQIVSVVQTSQSLSCPRGGFPSIRHNEIRDLTATLMTEVCNDVCVDVCVEPDLQALSSETMAADNARLDIAALRQTVSGEEDWNEPS